MNTSTYLMPDCLRSALAAFKILTNSLADAKFKNEKFKNLISCGMNIKKKNSINLLYRGM